MNRLLKTLTGLTLGIGLIIFLTSDAQSDDVSATAHNLTDDAALTVGALCEPCHTPHMDPSNTATAVLWNHSPSAASYTTRAGQTISGVTANCLSCHDGTVGVDNYFGGTNFGDDTNDISTAFPSTTADLGTDMTRQHPVGVAYPGSGDYQPSGTVTGAGLKLDSGNIECNSCHNPHDNTNQPLLHLANDASSTLCTTCHIK